MRPSIFESKKIKSMVSPLKPVSTGVGILFPELGWNLKKAGYRIDAILYISICILVALMVFVFGELIVAAPLIYKGNLDIITGTGIAVVLGALAFLYVMFIPSLKIARKKNAIDKNLEYMLKDMQIQLTAGIPLFDIFVNVANGGYGECSVVCNDVVRDVQSGKSIVNVLDEFGLLSASEYMRRVFWQIVNAMKTGSNVGVSLKMISTEIREEKENRITSYSQELGLWSLIYMIFVIVLPSMGVTLILILSSFLGSATITETVFWVILAAIFFFQIIFISIIRNKRPDIG
ncbi:MAG: type II secretion system F family protein [Candidatus Altiarchaeota archaeon]|nr:type II secretion system F family protein [Candidatus Altiarchaeota archaeon]